MAAFGELVIAAHGNVLATRLAIGAPEAAQQADLAACCPGGSLVRS
jgi:hypothetical protein